VTIEELKNEKYTLRKALSDLFNQFEKRTGVMIDRIDIDRTSITNHLNANVLKGDAVTIVPVVEVQDHISKIDIVLRGL